MLRTERYQQRELAIVIRHTGETNVGLRASSEKDEMIFGKRASDLPSAIRPKVEKDHAIAIPHGRRRFVALIDDYNRLHELIGDAFAVRLANSGDRITARASFTQSHQSISLLGALPSLIAVHRVVAPDDGCDFAHSVFAHLVDKLGDVTGSRIRGGVAPIQKSAHEDSFDV